MDDAILLKELTPVAERLLERHLATAKEWHPHEFVPWSRGRDFEPGEEWEPSEVAPSEAVRSALYLNLLTEDNLPYYFAHIDKTFGLDHPWGYWTRRWTAEEMRHATVIRDYVVVTRAIDPWVLERARMHQVTTGEVPEPPTVPDVLVYVTLQELATRIAHRNTGKHLTDQRGFQVLARVAADENLHHLFYRDLTSGAVDVAASDMVVAMENQVRAFQMPGTGILDFNAHSRRIANAGIYDVEILYEQVLVPVIRNHWRLESIEGLTPEAEEARAQIVRHLERLSRVAARHASRRAEEAETEDAQPANV